MRRLSQLLLSSKTCHATPTLATKDPESHARFDGAMPSSDALSVRKVTPPSAAPATLSRLSKTIYHYTSFGPDIYSGKPQPKTEPSPTPDTRFEGLSDSHSTSHTPAPKPARVLPTPTRSSPINIPPANGRFVADPSDLGLVSARLLSWLEASHPHLVADRKRKRAIHDVGGEERCMRPRSFAEPQAQSQSQPPVQPQVQVPVWEEPTVIITRPAPVPKARKAALYPTFRAPISEPRFRAASPTSNLSASTSRSSSESTAYSADPQWLPDYDDDD
ncbi:hypothetical protein BOTBODRAFT_523644 [Botryobasidium botryosum FD-172 SS1]|uniref:Uncharacterized protein n=1 Tax=Botryobasidium botryosum (strain FD-172 SS1) TaxID=930990 RepID=A0A067M164_BOTB1|nr:hypothetical protein BOTBODRAFT_523644 [Botryobasidium botryosum FD-172 SS1]